MSKFKDRGEDQPLNMFGALVYLGLNRLRGNIRILKERADMRARSRGRRVVDNGIGAVRTKLKVGDQIFTIVATGRLAKPRLFGRRRHLDLSQTMVMDVVRRRPRVNREDKGKGLEQR